MKTSYSALSFLLISILFLGQLKVEAQISGTKTVGTGGNYTTLTAAISAITAAGVNGPVVLELTSTYNSANETYPVYIGLIAGVSVVNTITIRPATGTTGILMSNSSAAAIFDLNGAKYITIDGRPGGTGTFSGINNPTLLSIVNSNTSGSAIRIQNDASFNTIKYCDLQGMNSTTGQVPGSQAGVVFIGPTNGTTGSDYNVIDNCSIHSTGNTQICTIGVYSYGPSGATSISAAFNDSNTVSNCNIYDMYGGSNLTTAGIECEKGTNGWIISGNSIFQTTARSPALTSAVANRGIYIATTNSTGVGNGFTITGNYIGGTAPKCGGTAWISNPTGAFNNLFDGITLTVAGGIASNVKGNVITNLNISQGAVTNDLFHGIWCQNTGDVNVGGPNVADGNVVGSASTTGAITLYSAGSGTAITHNPILVVSGPATSTTNILFQNNTVGGINLTGPGNGFSGIFCNATGPTVTIDRNLVGSVLVRNSINASDAGGSAVQFVCGIRSPSGAAVLTITNNIIANLNNSSTSTTATSGVSNTSISTTGGIIITGASTAAQIVKSISGNMVKNLTCAAFHGSNYVNTVLCGIGTNAAGGSPTTITDNIVDSLVATSNSTGTSQNIILTGIFYYTASSSSTTIIARNTVHTIDLTAYNPGCTMRGIEIIGGPVLAANNMIRLGLKSDGTSITTPVILYAFLTEATAVHYVYHNSVYVGGSNVTGTQNTMAYWRYNAGTDDIRNNIFVNSRSNASGATGKHYAIMLVGTTTLTLNNNIYYGTGTGTVFGTTNNGTTDVTSYTSGWVSGDANSYFLNPGFVNDTGMISTVNLHLKNPQYKGELTSVTGVLEDLDNHKRSLYPEIGADEFPMDLSVLSVDSPGVSSFCGSTKSIWATIKNQGQVSLTSAALNVTVNGTYAYTYNWNGNLAPAASIQVNLGGYNFTGGNYKLSVSSTLASGFVDNNVNNDSAFTNLTVIPTVVPNITISTPLTSVCTGSTVTFKNTYSGGGSSPVLQWKRNSANVGTSDSLYSTSSLSNKDTIWCTLTSNATCANPAIVSSAKIIMTVASSLVPTITVQSNDTNICVGKPSSFTTTINNGGLTPHYQWRKNGVVVGSDSVALKITNPSNKDTITCIMTSSLACASKSADTSKAVIITVNPLITPTAVISATANQICSGIVDTFTSVITNGGTNPVYSWRIGNGTPVGTNNNKLILNNLKDKDSVYLVLSSNAACLAQTTATSNKIGITVFPVVVPSVTVSASKNLICVGDSVQLTANPINGGSAPIKEWYVNSSKKNFTKDTIFITGLSNNDTVYYKLISNAPCLQGGAEATSNKIIIAVNQYVTPSVTITPSATQICSGTQVTFKANGLNTGSTPHYTWKKNGIGIGNDDTLFSSTLINNNDTVVVILKSNNLCQTRNGDTSAKVVMKVTPSVTPSATVTTTNLTVCHTAPTLFNSSITNGGSAPTYKWMKNGQQVGGDSSALLLNQIDNKDTVYLQLTSNAVCATSTNVLSNKLLMTALPDVITSITINESANSICSGSSVTFNSTPQNGGLTPIYRWYRNGIQVGNGQANYSTDSLADGDSMMVKMTSSLTCALPLVASSNAIRMKVLKRETPEVKVIVSRDSACSGDAVTFTAVDSLPLSLKQHQWFKNGSFIGTDTTIFTTNVSVGDKFKCVLYAKANCVTKGSDTASANLVITQIPVKPNVSRRMDTLESTASQSYQWFLNNNSIPGANGKVYRMTQNGSYKVKITANGCSNTSDTIGFYKLGVQSKTESVFIKAWPNPSKDKVYIDLSLIEPIDIQIQVVDISGRIVIDSPKELPQSNNRYELNLSSLPSGMYLIKVNHVNGSWLGKIVKE